MNGAQGSQELRQRAALALAVLFLVRCLWLPAHLAFEHHHAPGASAAALGLAHAHERGHHHGHGHGHSLGFGHDHDADRDGPRCPEEPTPHTAADHQPDMRIPRALHGAPPVVQALPACDVVLPEPSVLRAANPPRHELPTGKSPPRRPPARAPPIA